MLLLDNVTPMNIEYFNVTLVDNTGLALDKTFTSGVEVVGVVIVDHQNPIVAVVDLKYAVSAGVITVTGNFTGNVTIKCKLAVLYRI